MVSRVLNPASSLPTAPPEGFRPGFTAMGTLPYPCSCEQDIASAGGLSPDHYRRGYAGLVSYYALFKGMAASKPTSQLSQHDHILSYTEPPLRGLSRRSGFFPSRQRTLSHADCLPGSIKQVFGVWLGEVWQSA